MNELRLVNAVNPFIPDCVVIYSKKHELFKEFQTTTVTERWIPKMEAPTWPNINTRGCPLQSGMIVAGSVFPEHSQKVELLDTNYDGPKQLPQLWFPSACVGMAWNENDNSLILAGGDQFKNGNWNETSDMFQLTNVGTENTTWEKLESELPSAMASPELLIGDNYLYLLGGHASLKCARISDHFEGNWEKLPDLLHDFDSSIGTGGAVFMNDQVVVFTLEYIMILYGNGEEASWEPISIKNKRLRHCIPRLFNGDIIVLMERLRDNGTTETIIERYDINAKDWKSWTPSARNDPEVGEASLDPWKFFIMHYDVEPLSII